MLRVRWGREIEDRNEQTQRQNGQGDFLHHSEFLRGIVDVENRSGVLFYYGKGTRGRKPGQDFRENSWASPKKLRILLKYR